MAKGAITAAFNAKNQSLIHVGSSYLSLTYVLVAALSFDGIFSIFVDPRHEYTGFYYYLQYNVVSQKSTHSQ